MCGRDSAGRIQTDKRSRHIHTRDYWDLMSCATEHRELTTPIQHPSAFAGWGTTSGEESLSLQPKGTSSMVLFPYFTFLFFSLMVLYLPTVGFFSWTLELEAMPFQPPYLCLWCHLCVLWLCSTDVLWLLLMTVQCLQQPKLWLHGHEGYIRAELWGLGHRWLLLGWGEEVTARAADRSFYQSNKPKEMNIVVYGWVKAWFFYIKKPQYLIFILANNSLHPDIRRAMGSDNRINFKHP